MLNEEIEVGDLISRTTPSGCKKLYLVSRIRKHTIHARDIASNFHVDFWYVEATLVIKRFDVLFSV